MSVNRTSSERGTDTMTRAVDSLKSAVNGSMPSRSHSSSSQIRAPTPYRRRRLGQRHGQAAVGQVVRGVDHAVTAGVDEDLAQQLLGFQVDLRRQATEVPVDDVRPVAPASSSRVVPNR